MTGEIFVETLNNRGTYVSKMDYDKGSKGPSNPRGFFKIVIQPIRDDDGNNIIKYAKTENGYIVSGEAYVVTGKGEKTIDSKIKKEFKPDMIEFINLRHVEYEPVMKLDCGKPIDAIINKAKLSSSDVLDLAEYYENVSVVEKETGKEAKVNSVKRMLEDGLTESRICIIGNNMKSFHKGSPNWAKSVLQYPEIQAFQQELKGKTVTTSKEH